MMLAENELPLLKDQQPPLLEIQFLCLCVFVMPNRVSVSET